MIWFPLRSDSFGSICKRKILLRHFHLFLEIVLPDSCGNNISNTDAKCFFYIIVFQSRLKWQGTVWKWKPYNCYNSQLKLLIYKFFLPSWPFTQKKWGATNSICFCIDPATQCSFIFNTVSSPLLMVLCVVNEIIQLFLLWSVSMPYRLAGKGAGRSWAMLFINPKSIPRIVQLRRIN